MKHRVKKFKSKGGQDANEMLTRKLVRNFVAHGTLTTTQTRVKHVATVVQKLAQKACRMNSSDYNALLPYFTTRQQIERFSAIAKEQAKDGDASGCVKIVKIGFRPNDAAPVAKLTWKKDMKPAVAEKGRAEKKDAKTEAAEKKAKTETKPKEKAKKTKVSSEQ